MALSFSRLPWLWLSGKAKGQVLKGDPKSLKFYSNRRDDDYDDKMPSRKAKRKWKSREERSKMVDKEHDVVLVPSDGVGLSGSESDESDWSIGWLEPHAPGFHSDGDTDDSFAVLVPCYRHDSQEFVENSVEFLGDVKNSPNGFSDGSREYMEKWLSSLQKF